MVVFSQILRANLGEVIVEAEAGFFPLVTILSLSLIS